MLAGLMSRCTSPSEWASYSEPQICSQDVNHARHRLRTVALDQRLQVDAVEKLHGVIEHAFRRAAVVVDRHGVGIVELAGDLHLAFEALDGAFVHLVGLEHFDGRWPAEHGVLRLVDDAHPAGAHFAFELVLADLLGFDRGLLGLAARAGQQNREYEDGGGAQGQQREQPPERPPQNRQRAEGLGVVDFGDDADVAFGQPLPRPDDRHAAVVAVAVDIHAGPPGHGFANRVGQRQVAATRGRDGAPS